MKMHKKKTALICGISGQDGSYLAKYLLKKNYKVFGTSRFLINQNFENLSKLKIKNRIKIYKLNPIYLKNIKQIIHLTNPNEIYYLNSLSSVKESIINPKASFNSTFFGLLNFLEILRKGNNSIKLFNACSSECFGNIKKTPVNENSPFNPQSPYAVAKSASYMLIKNYRKSYQLHLTNGILFNHESSLRSNKFLSKRIISEVIKINQNKKLKMFVNNIDDLKRDWGWAPEYVKAMHLINNDVNPDDYIVATGKSYSLRDLIKFSFRYFNLDYKDFIIEKKNSSFSMNSFADPSKIYHNLKWKAKSDLKDIVKKMIDNEL